VGIGRRDGGVYEKHSDEGWKTCRALCAHGAIRNWRGMSGLGLGSNRGACNEDVRWDAASIVVAAVDRRS
jgi:hypothetical protein